MSKSGFGVENAFAPLEASLESGDSPIDLVGDVDGLEDNWENLEDTKVPVDLQADLDAGLASVLYWRALIMPVRPQKKSRGGLILVEESRANAQYLTYIGRVVALGPLWCTGPNFGPQTDRRSWFRRTLDRFAGVADPQFQRDVIKSGDWVLYGRHSGQRVEYRGVKMLLVNDDDKLMKIRSPEGWRIYT